MSSLIKRFVIWPLLGLLAGFLTTFFLLVNFDSLKGDSLQTTISPIYVFLATVILGFLSDKLYPLSIKKEVNAGTVTFANFIFWAAVLFGVSCSVWELSGSYSLDMVKLTKKEMGFHAMFKFCDAVLLTFSLFFTGFIIRRMIKIIRFK